MKILLTTIRHQIDSPSGSARIAHDESVALARRGHEVWVLAEAHRSDLDEYEVDGEGRLVEEIRSEGLAEARLEERAEASDVERRVGVVASARRSGVGEALMRALHEEARERGVRRVWLEVIVENTAAFTRRLIGP